MAITDTAKNGIVFPRVLRLFRFFASFRFFDVITNILYLFINFRFINLLLITIRLCVYCLSSFESIYLNHPKIYGLKMILYFCDDSRKSVSFRLVVFCVWQTVDCTVCQDEIIETNLLHVVIISVLRAPVL